MKKYLLLSIGMLMVVSTYAAQPNPFKMIQKNKHHERTSETDQKRAKALMTGFFKAPEKVENWKPTRSNYYEWNGSGWNTAQNSTYTYTSSGMVLQMVTSLPGHIKFVTDNTYNENEKLISSIISLSSGNEPLMEMMRLDCEYDAVLTDVTTLNETSMSLAGQTLVMNGSMRRNIARNDKGCIIEVVTEEYGDDQYQPEERLLIEYGPDGKASVISEYYAEWHGGYYTWKQEASLSDIIWEHTDGQIYDMEKIFQGNNRIKSAKLYIADMYDEDSADGEQLKFDVTAEYSDVPGFYAITIAQPEYGITGSSTYMPKENGGYEITSHSTDGVIEFEEKTYDKWGNLLSSYSECTEGTYTEIEEDIIGSVEYNDNGFPIVYIVEERERNPDSSQITSLFRSKTEFFDYVNVTSRLENVESDSHAQVMYFNLQGHPVRHPAKGSVYIRREGAKAEKIIIR